ncbi:MAG: hypothetical protein HY075_04225 [Deltaproteobacteria bacterium]|nr:hypothetical protein [Deltaproteobacteria bacterium]
MILGLLLSIALAAPPYVERGDAVEKKYEHYTQKLAEGHALIKLLLKRDAPDLYRRFTPEPPKPIPYGYQILPKLSPSPPFEERHDPPRAVSTPYSWDRTETYIDWQLPKVDELVEQLSGAQKVPLKDRRQIYERYAREYPQLEADQRLVDNHIQYNRFWQKTIAEDRPRFDRLTKLHDLVLERQRILDLGPNATPELREKERKMAQTIHSQNSEIHPPSYLKLTHRKPHVWQIEAPIYTDISDPVFLDKAKKAIESAWTIEERENTYRMKVVFRHFQPKPAPKRGSHLDVKAHAARFPHDGGVVTTGTNSTYAIPGRYIALGPHPLSYNVLAHEFGHILGFIDGYFRGYHDLGPRGFEVLEVVPDPSDIMCTPSVGRVLPYHYETIFKRYGSQ